ncbi:COX15/CtaA family protein [Undibacterium fentianense]|uniref:COX15/CtaA family protein n=1 Tax=Undibacterium fentianense TaxID=2828728 RepID=A0A941ICZ6_9BURK|nr:COX15/CtaA family protein [Undibacterium fentianense]MBR7800749.1 COX15/CtaA family protein [Undibacterium fentianense]
MLAQLAITGLLVALFPLTIVWASKDSNKYRKLIAVTLFLTFDLIVFGAFTRLTDSGLGCPDWPGCYGQANPFQAHSEIRAAESLMPTGPVTLVKAWIEMIHRYIAMSVGVLVSSMMVIAWWRRASMRFSPRLPTALFVLVLVQGAFGKWTVTMKLQPIIVTIHLLLALCILSLLVWAWMRETPFESFALPRWLRQISSIAMIVLLLQVALGGWVSTNYAALACHDYPTCNGQLIPELDVQHAYALWRELGKTLDGDFIPHSALVTIHWVHRSFAWVVFIVLGITVALARRSPELKQLANGVGLILFCQFLSGVATIYFSWPLTIAVLHNAGAAALVLLLSMLNYRVRSSAKSIFQ